mmetsp:Transcript_27868/g.54879  ORF Transcript_27868/g.54879 Transcript_27868/m.54879 type:complete len:365 (+) Transcript_27868:61-1155(+)|eukprot:CAMPEP_0175144518 /NCGR_PEP_ID=MMETSP0087-20121206/14186_1 /TAXON_ID=136419 /ORGANISM="Unknown Unknown, Strain D1" /LENGTH=364 /DNA_ID=CAMNT_0016429015 /DNA_START=57 /DNA_END=1151 /DNA_ORIENTATION=+
MSQAVVKAMSPYQRFLFDLNGFIVVRNALSKAEVKSMNTAVDANLTAAVARESAMLRNTKADTHMTEKNPRIDLGGCLNWEKAVGGDTFRSLLAHSQLVPYLNAMLGPGYRMDHQPLVLINQANSEGFSLHGGPLSATRPEKKRKYEYETVEVPDEVLDTGKFNPALQYKFSPDGGMFNSLVAMSVALSPVKGNVDGGFCILRGSHKLNFPVPTNFANGDVPEFREHIHVPDLEAGDVVFFSEATVHGCMPWKNAEMQRRCALFRFAPSILSYGRAYFSGDSNFGMSESKTSDREDFLPFGISRHVWEHELTEAQKSVLLPPFTNRCERPELQVDADGKVTVHTFERSKVKKAHDRAIFGTDYF